MTIAIAVKDGKAIAYVCDGKKIEAWLDGTLQGDTLALTGKGGASVKVATTRSDEPTPEQRARRVLPDLTVAIEEVPCPECDARGVKKLVDVLRAEAAKLM